jgi:cytochrome b561
MATAAAMTGQEAARYTRVAIWLHWIIAALIVANLTIGLIHDDLDRAIRGPLMNFHKATGITILVLTLARLAWRLTHRPPPDDPVMKPWERALAHLTQWVFYGLLIILPLTGWLLISTGKNSLMGWYGLFTVPPLPAAKATHEIWSESHEILGYAMLVLLLLHVAGALKHHFGGDKHLIGRMAPWLAPRR